MATTNGVVYALDFDGVLCNSEPESSVSGVRAALDVWGDDESVPALYNMKRANGGTPKWLQSAMRKARPMIHTGFENLLLVRAFAEAGEKGVDELVQRIIKSWPDLRKQYMEEYGSDEQQLVEAFGAARDRWIANDVESWLNTNQL